MAGMSWELRRFFNAIQNCFSLRSGISCSRVQRFLASIPPQRGIAFHFHWYARSIHSLKAANRVSFGGVGSGAVRVNSIFPQYSGIPFGVKGLSQRA